jgi:hypothetical protein
MRVLMQDFDMQADHLQVVRTREEAWRSAQPRDRSLRARPVRDGKSAGVDAMGQESADGPCGRAPCMKATRVVSPGLLPLAQCSTEN